MTYRKSEQDVPNGDGSLRFYYDNPSFLSSESEISTYETITYLGGNPFTVVKKDIRKPTIALSEVKQIQDCGQWVREKCGKICTKKIVYRKVPILRWLPHYNRSYAVGDLVAGITIGMTLIPQGLAFSSIVGVPTQHGLYGSFLGCFVYIIFGSCKDVSFGPTAIQSLLVYQAAGQYGIEYVILLCLLSGLVQIFMGLLSLGFLVDFISEPVSSGFTVASALIVVVSLMKDILGVDAKGTAFIDWCISLSKNIEHTRPGDATMGFSCIAFLLLMKYVCSRRIGPKDPGATPKKIHIVVNKILWFFGISRNAISVVICAVIGYKYCVRHNVGPFAKSSGNSSDNLPIPFKLIGFVPEGLPQFKVPPFGYTEVVNGTRTEHSFVDMVGRMSGEIFVVAIIGLLENIAVCKAFDEGEGVDATQELLALGIANVVNSFAQAFSGTGAIARSAVNHASGARTTLGGIYSGVLVMVSLIVFTPYFYFIPRATLSAIIITAVLVMIKFQILGPMWKTKRRDCFLWTITFVACLALPLEYGILIGVLINLILTLYRTARPKIIIKKLETPSGLEFLLFVPDSRFIFPSTDYLKKEIKKHNLRQKIPIVIDCSHVYEADFTSASVIANLTQDFAEKNQRLLFYNLKPSLCKVMEGVHPKNLVVFYETSTIDELLKEGKENGTKVVDK